MLGEAIRKDFPQYGANKDLVYLDSAASSLTPEPVLVAMDEYYRTYRANAHRGFYKEAQKATARCESARETIAEYIGATSNEIIFTSGATMGANMLAWALFESSMLQRDGEVVLTVLDHHSQLLPFRNLAKRLGLTVRYLGLEGTALAIKDVEQVITKKTKLVCLPLASNVLGAIPDVSKIVQHSHDMGALVVADGTAGVGHIPVQVKDLDIDFLFFSGHKMCGPTGTGAMYGKKEHLEALSPGIVGGGMVEDVTLTDARWRDAPSRFEAGTQNIAGIIGLGEAVRYINALGIENIRNHSEMLTAYAQKKLIEIEGVTLYSAKPEENTGIISFSIHNIHPHDIAEVAGKHGVAIRAGHHCALPLHTALNADVTARASFYVYNTKKDIDALLTVVQESQRIFHTHE